MFTVKKGSFEELEMAPTGSESDCGYKMLLRSLGGFLACKLVFYWSDLAGL